MNNVKVWIQFLYAKGKWKKKEIKITLNNL